MTRGLIVALLLGLCAWQTRTRLEAWRSDEALWTAAVRTAPGLPRPALNLAAVYLRQGQWARALPLTWRAVLLADARREAYPQWRAIRQAAKWQIRWIDQQIPICEASPALLPFCVWVS